MNDQQPFKNIVPLLCDEENLMQHIASRNRAGAQHNATLFMNN